jgi:hypothetical protein
MSNDLWLVIRLHADQCEAAYQRLAARLRRA